MQIRLKLYFRRNLDLTVKLECFPISNPTDFQMPVRWVPDHTAAAQEVGSSVMARRIVVGGAWQRQRCVVKHPRAGLPCPVYVLAAGCSDACLSD